MNRKQKVLTVIALIAFVLIGAAHYIYGKSDWWNLEIHDPSDSLVPDVRITWFMLGVIYVGLFFLLADKKEKQ